MADVDIPSCPIHRRAVLQQPDCFALKRNSPPAAFRPSVQIQGALQTPEAYGEQQKIGWRRMSRLIFLTLYIPVALFFSGGFASPWNLTLMALRFGQQGAAALLSPLFLISFLAPIALIVLAYARGRRIGNKTLIWFPIAAFILTLTPMLFVLLSNILSGTGPHKAGGAASVYAAMIMGTVSTLGPLILHTICCVLGAGKDSQEKRDDPSIRRDKGYDNVIPGTLLVNARNDSSNG